MRTLIPMTVERQAEVAHLLKVYAGTLLAGLGHTRDVRNVDPAYPPDANQQAAGHDTLIREPVEFRQGESQRE